MVNTVLSLCAATVGTFVASSFLNNSWKVRPVDIQNATLAGGVAIGAVCNLTLNPSDPLMIGFVAGILSTYGFSRIQPLLENSYGLHDTCGIHNLHGMPSILGGFASVFLCAHKGPLHHDMPDVFHHTGQGGNQFAAILLTLITAVATGVLSGYVMRRFAPMSNTDLYSDLPYWEVEPFIDHVAHASSGGATGHHEDEEAGLGGEGGGGGEGTYGKLDGSRHLHEAEEESTEMDHHGSGVELKHVRL